MSYETREKMLELGPFKDPVKEALRRMIAEFGSEPHYHTCPADNDSGPCDCFAGHLIVDVTRILTEAVAFPQAHQNPEGVDK